MIQQRLFVSCVDASPAAGFGPLKYSKGNTVSFRRTLLACSLPFALTAAVPAFAADSDVFALSRAPAGATLAAVSDATPMRVILSLPLGDEAGARAYGDAVSTPGNPLYGHFLTPAEFGARFGGDAATYESLRSWAASQGLDVGPRLDNRAEISLGGTAGQFAALFGTHFQSFDTVRGPGYTVTNTPKLPDVLSGKVDGVIGLTSQSRLGTLARHPRVHTDVGTGVDGSGYAPADLTTAYDIPTQKGTSTEVVAIFEQDGYKQSDLTTFEKAYKLANVPNKAVSVNKSTTGVTGNGAEIEADLDIDMVIGLNPMVNDILVYIDNKDSFQTALLDAINQVGQDNKASVFSISYGQDESQQGTSAIKAEGKALIQLQTEGITVFASAGDDGASGRTGSGLHASDPGAQPLLTSVGGTDLSTKTGEKYSKEVVWNTEAQQGAATGGGVSSVWTIPTWQVVNGVSVATKNGGSSTNRNLPDIAAIADDINSPVSIYSADYGGWLAIGGTSVSAPVWAAWTSIFNGDRVAAGTARLGFLNPLLYTLGEAAKNFHDVKKGNNKAPGQPGYTAGKGYDNCTGWGSIDVGKALASFTQ
jgi:kumamolisin